MDKRSLGLIGAAALATLVGGCQKQAAADPGAAKSAITADQTKWNAEFKARDMEGLVGHYAEDAYMVAPGLNAADGSMAIRKIYADGLADPTFTFVGTRDKVDAAASGDLGYARGHFTENYTDPKTGKAMTTSGSYITVYKKQQDGSWKAVEDFAASDPDATKPVEPGKPATRAKMVSM